MPVAMLKPKQPEWVPSWLQDVLNDPSTTTVTPELGAAGAIAAPLMMLTKSKAQRELILDALLERSKKIFDPRTHEAFEAVVKKFPRTMAHVGFLGKTPAQSDRGGSVATIMRGDRVPTFTSIIEQAPVSMDLLDAPHPIVTNDSIKAWIAETPYHEAAHVAQRLRDISRAGTSDVPTAVASAEKRLQKVRDRMAWEDRPHEQGAVTTALNQVLKSQPNLSFAALENANRYIPGTPRRLPLRTKRLVMALIDRERAKK